LSGLMVSKSDVERALHKAELTQLPASEWTDKEFFAFALALQRTSKPMIIAANKIDRGSAPRNFTRLKEKLGENVVPCCALGEFALRSFAEKGLITYRPGDKRFVIEQREKIDEKTSKLLKKLHENVLSKYGSTGVQECINRLVYNVLNMIVVYPVEDVNSYSDHHGNVLPDALLVPKGTTTRGLAFRIHTQLGETFIHAINGRTKRRIGEDYVLEDHDIIKIVAAAGHK
ncbi:MAG: TGS domain-containing protein, partial [Candidatus Ranarchaeia archaeon]